MRPGPASSATRPAARRDLAWLLAIAVLGFALRLAAVFQYQSSHPNAASVVIDERSYDRWARAIAGGDWMGREVFFQEPLYPYALGSLYAVAGPSLLVARVAHCVLWAAAIVLIGLLARRLFGRAAGFVAAALVALHGPGLVFPSLILKENLFLPVLAGLALLLVRSRSLAGNRARIAWVAIGVLGGLGALLRGNVLVLLPVLALWPIARNLFQRERVAPAFVLSAAFVLGVACALVPVAWRNAHVGGVFVLTTSGAGTNVYGGNNLENPYGRATEFSFVRGIPEYEAGDWAREAERRSGGDLAPNEVSSFWMREALRSMRERPLDHARILWNKLRLSLGRYEVPDNHMLDWDARYVAIARGPWPDFGVTGALGLAGVLTWVALLVARRRAPAQCAGGATELAILFALYLGTIVLTVTSDRARLPLLVMLAPFAAFTSAAVVEWFRGRRPVEGAILAVALAVALCAAYVPALPAADRAEDWDERDYNLSVQWIDDAAHAEDGRRIADALLAKHPRTARVQLLALTYAQRRAARLARASDETTRQAGGAQLESVLREAGAIADDERVFPRERFRANSLAAWVALDAGRIEEAERRFGLARKFDQDANDLRNGEARARLARAALDFESARSLLAADEAQREPARARMESALDRLQLVAADRAVDVGDRAEARRIAGWIQFGLGRLPNAERHFRAARELADSADARLGLARVLAARAQALAPGAERESVVREARGLAEGLDPTIRAQGGLDAALEALGNL
ncbi:MAG: glycosyltransferase family 39 protein [Planctomycetota bacterium]|nr:glycosyltransferase family 39 protein [Planctomycetota bacterium]